eukprot:TRINITY_DN1792_c0_g1_i1.p1 TRINITY_DN1792_c0_g1~~TRINITY_DN1792_c0_g1_i1.p1  ORF type:complete len:898 (+),score=257.59 TRINITY_DN1792_c0_g1_i1:77-2770(+)
MGFDPDVEVPQLAGTCQAQCEVSDTLLLQWDLNGGDEDLPGRLYCTLSSGVHVMADGAGRLRLTRGVDMETRTDVCPSDLQGTIPNDAAFVDVRPRRTRAGAGQRDEWGPAFVALIHCDDPDLSWVVLFRHSDDKADGPVRPPSALLQLRVEGPQAVSAEAMGPFPEVIAIMRANGQLVTCDVQGCIEMAKEQAGPSRELNISDGVPSGIIRMPPDEHDPSVDFATTSDGSTFALVTAEGSVVLMVSRGGAGAGDQKGHPSKAYCWRPSRDCGASGGISFVCMATMPSQPHPAPGGFLVVVGFDGGDFLQLFHFVNVLKPWCCQQIRLAPRGGPRLPHLVELLAREDEPHAVLLLSSRRDPLCLALRLVGHGGRWVADGACEWALGQPPAGMLYAAVPLSWSADADRVHVSLACVSEQGFHERRARAAWVPLRLGAAHQVSAEQRLRGLREEHRRLMEENARLRAQQGLPPWGPEQDAAHEGLARVRSLRRHLHTLEQRSQEINRRVESCADVYEQRHQEMEDWLSRVRAAATAPEPPTGGGDDRARAEFLEVLEPLLMGAVDDAFRDLSQAAEQQSARTAELGHELTARLAAEIRELCSEQRIRAEAAGGGAAGRDADGDPQVVAEIDSQLHDKIARQCAQMAADVLQQQSRSLVRELTEACSHAVGALRRGADGLSSALPEAPPANGPTPHTAASPRFAAAQQAAAARLGGAVEEVRVGIQGREAWGRMLREGVSVWEVLPRVVRAGLLGGYAWLLRCPEAQLPPGSPRGDRPAEGPASSRVLAQALLGFCQAGLDTEPPRARALCYIEHLSLALRARAALARAPGSPPRAPRAPCETVEEAEEVAHLLKIAQSELSRRQGSIPAEELRPTRERLGHTAALWDSQVLRRAGPGET